MSEWAGLAVFDLDHTIIGMDSEMEFCRFAERSCGGNLEELDGRFGECRRLYLEGVLDYGRMADAVMGVLGKYPAGFLEALGEQWLPNLVAAVKPQAMDRVRWHRQRGDLAILASASNSAVVAMAAKALGFEHWAASDLRRQGACYADYDRGMFCFGEGKPKKAEILLGSLGLDWGSFDEVWAYSDSINDEALLRRADYAVAVDPDERLRALAESQAWRVCEWNPR